MKYPEQAAALAKELAEQLREEQRQQQEAVQSENTERDDADATLESVELIETMMVGVTDQAKTILGADRCTLWLVNAKTQQMWSFLSDADGSGSTKMQGEDSNDAVTAERVLRVKVGTGLAGCCAATGEVIEVQDAASDERFDKSHDEKTGYRTKAVVCVPIVKAPKRRTRAQRKLDRLSGDGSNRGSFKGTHARLVGVRVACMHCNTLLCAVLNSYRLGSRSRIADFMASFLQNRVVGVMQVLNRTDGRDGGFDSKAVDALTKLATDAGLVLQATKLYREITGLYDMVRDENT